MTDRLSRIRSAIVDLDRAGLRKLALAAHSSREAIEDFGAIGAALPSDAMAAVEAWFSLWELRSMLNNVRNGPLKAAMYEATGIPLSHRDAFEAGDDTALTADELAKARDYLTGKSTRPAQPVTAMSAQPPQVFALRGEALRIINGMSDDALAAFIAEHRPAKAA